MLSATAMVVLSLVMLLSLDALAPAPPVEAVEEEAVRAPVEAVVAGSAAAGFVGGALLAMPALFSLLPLTGPWVAAPVAFMIVGMGAGFGGFLGALTGTRIPTALAVGATALAGAVLGASVLSIGAGTIGASMSDPTSVFLGAVVGGAVGGLAGAAGAGALGAAFWITPPEEPHPAPVTAPTTTTAP